MTTPRLARSLTALLEEIDDAYPVRDKRSDGWLGDAAHAARMSDHNPDERGVVHALDVDVTDIAAWPIVVAITHHPATHYVIYRSVLFSRRHRFVGVPYRGVDPHTSHFHVSIRPTVPAERTRLAWLVGSE